MSVNQPVINLGFAYSTRITPASVLGGALWLRAKSMQYSDGAAVGWWNNDAAAALPDAEQTVSANRPVFNVNGGNSYVEFDGVNDFLTVGDNFDILGNSQSLFIVAKRTVYDGVMISKSLSTSQQGAWGMAFEQGANRHGGYFRNSSFKVNNVAVALENSFVLFESHINRTAGTLAFYRNGILINTQSWAPEQNTYNHTVECMIGRASGAAYFKGGIKEIFLAQRPAVLTANEINGLRSYFNSEHNLW